MPFIVDLLPPAADIEAAAALGLAMAERKSKGLFGRKQYEPIEVVARFALPLRTVTWTPGETTGRCLVFNPQGLVSGSIRFDLSPIFPRLIWIPRPAKRRSWTCARAGQRRPLNLPPAL